MYLEECIIDVRAQILYCIEAVRTEAEAKNDRYRRKEETLHRHWRWMSLQLYAEHGIEPVVPQPLPKILADGANEAAPAADILPS